MRFQPGPGVGGHCIPIDPSYLRFSSNLINESVRLVDISDDINESLPRQIALRIQVELDGVLEDKLIQIAGISYKPNISDLRESPALELIKELETAGAIVSWHDPFVDEYNGKHSVALSKEIDLGLIVTPHSKIDFSIWTKTNIKVIDLSANANNYGWPKFL
jgi:UDP-N-acetyl-D-glucosamine dehydrogenase